jgi:hypothetical protein
MLRYYQRYLIVCPGDVVDRLPEPITPRKRQNSFGEFLCTTVRAWHKYVQQLTVRAWYKCVQPITVRAWYKYVQPLNVRAWYKYVQPLTVRAWYEYVQPLTVGS